MIGDLRRALALFLLFTLLVGGAYPLFVHLIGSAAMPRQADGRVLADLVRPARAERDAYFVGRPRPGRDDDVSGGSNLAPTNPAFLRRTAELAVLARRANPDAGESVPVDLVTSSGSGLDPHISLAAARFQAPRVAKARGLSVEQVRDVISSLSEERHWGVLGQPAVHVARLNSALDERFGRP